MDKTTRISIAITTLILVIFWTLVLTIRITTPSVEVEGDDKIMAWIMTEKFVKDYLKSPSTADFGNLWSDDQDPETLCYLHE